MQFFGIEFEAQAVFFVVDRSGSFNSNGKFTRTKQEVVTTLSSLTEDFEIALFFFDRFLIRWPVPEMPARATEENKLAAIAFVESMRGGQATCPEPALLRALEYASKSSVRTRAIFYAGDGGATCNAQTDAENWRQTIDAVTAANNGTASIHAIHITDPDGGHDEQYVRELAEKNGGTFHHIDL